MLRTTSRRTVRKFAIGSIVLLTAALVACGGENPAEARDETSADAGIDARQTDSSGTDPGPETTVDSGEFDSGESEPEGTVSLSLGVYTIDGEPIEDATVQLDGEEQKTDQNGAVEFEGLESGRLVSKIDAFEFAPATSVVDAPTSTSIHRTVHLLRRGEVKQFDPTTPTDLYENRVHVHLPANAFVTEEGETYTGTVVATITPLNPSTSERYGAPGPMMGILEGDSDPTPMESLFMADIQFRSSTPEPRSLELKDDKKASLEFVLPDEMQSEYAKGDEVEAYWYDTDAGVWRQEGRGTVRPSSYAAGRLAWMAEVSHFTWWNADKPWRDKNCANVEVVEKQTGAPVAGASVIVEGVSYNGYSAGVTGANGQKCLDFKRGSNARVKVTPPKGFYQSGSPTQITGSSTASACSGQGGGSCKKVTLKVDTPTCASGSIVDASGNGIGGVDVVGTFRGSRGPESVSATTGPSGDYCLKVPPNRKISVTARHKSNGIVESASTTVTAGSASKTCGSGSCTSIPKLTPKPGKTGCLRGRAMVDAPSGVRSAAAGTHVYAFAGTQNNQGAVNVDCSKPPKQWGTLLAKTTTNSNGDYCLEVPTNVQHVSVVVGKCASGRECVIDHPTTGPANTGSCLTGNCKRVSRIGLPVCAEGP